MITKSSTPDLYAYFVLFTTRKKHLRWCTRNNLHDTLEDGLLHYNFYVSAANDEAALITARAKLNAFNVQDARIVKVEVTKGAVFSNIIK